MLFQSVALSNTVYAGLDTVLFSFLVLLVAVLVGIAIYVDADRRGDEDAILVGLFVGLLFLLGVIPGIIALFSYLYYRNRDESILPFRRRQE